MFAHVRPISGAMNSVCRSSPILDIEGWGRIRFEQLVNSFRSKISFFMAEAIQVEYAQKQFLSYPEVYIARQITRPIQYLVPGVD